jgi:peptidoglycan hydrolase CwlO-like protein
MFKDRIITTFKSKRIINILSVVIIIALSIVCAFSMNRINELEDELSWKEQKLENIEDELEYTRDELDNCYNRNRKLQNDVHNINWQISNLENQLWRNGIR